MNKILFWDFDGTLSYPNKSFFTALHTAVSEIGYSTDLQETVDFLQKTYSWKTPHIEYPDKINILWWDSFFEKIHTFCNEKNICDTDIDKICSRFKELLIDVSNYELYDDTKETLKKCMQKGYKNYLITNNYPEITENLEKLSITDFFTDYIISSHIGYEKPRKEFFDIAKKIAGNPEMAYVIGDNPIADIQGGKDAGLTTIAVRECKTGNADYYAEKLSDILSII